MNFAESIRLTLRYCIAPVVFGVFLYLDFLSVSLRLMPNVIEVHDCTLVVEGQGRFESFWFKCEDDKNRYQLNLASSSDDARIEKFIGQKAKIFAENDLKNKRVRYADFQSQAFQGRTASQPRDGVFLMMVSVYFFLSVGIGKAIPYWMFKNTRTSKLMLTNIFGIKR